MKLKSILASAVFSLASVGAQAAVLTFDGLSNVHGYGVPGPNITLTDRSLSYHEDGYVLTLHTPNAEPDIVHIGDVTFQPSFNWHDGGENGSGSYVTLRRADGGAFDLESFFYNDPMVGFTARAGGYADRFLIEFGTMTDPYRNVTEVRFFGVDNYSELDNMVVNAAAEVPEPGSLALLLAGLGMAGAVRRRRARSA